MECFLYLKYRFQLCSLRFWGMQCGWVLTCRHLLTCLLVIPLCIFPSWWMSRFFSRLNCSVSGKLCSSLCSSSSCSRVVVTDGLFFLQVSTCSFPLLHVFITVPPIPVEMILSYISISYRIRAFVGTSLFLLDYVLIQTFCFSRASLSLYLENVTPLRWSLLVRALLSSSCSLLLAVL